LHRAERLCTDLEFAGRRFITLFLWRIDLAIRCRVTELFSSVFFGLIANHAEYPSYNVPNDDFSRLRFNKPLADLLDTLKEFPNIGPFELCNDTQEEMSSCDRTWSRVLDLPSLK
jgi:hypothetical protein